jgi:hypothetical protein
MKNERATFPPVLQTLWLRSRLRCLSNPALPICFPAKHALSQKA